MLKPVKFGKGREHEPRLTKPYVPGRTHSRFWTEEHLAIIRENYAAKGAAFCLSLLPGKTLTGVYQQAHKMGLRANADAPKRRARVGDSLDDIILARWPSLAGKGAVQRFADELGVRRFTISQRATKLGLTMPHKKEPPWTKEEDELLKRAPVNNPERASAFFAAHGFKRSPSAIIVRCKRQAVSRRRSDVLSCRTAALILGIDSHVIADWIAAGELPAEERGTKRLPQQGGDYKTIQPADFRRFIIENIDRIDIRKVDKHSFVALLAGNAG